MIAAWFTISYDSTSWTLLDDSDLPPPLRKVHIAIAGTLHHQPHHHLGRRTQNQLYTLHFHLLALYESGRAKKLALELHWRKEFVDLLPTWVIIICSLLASAGALNKVTICIQLSWIMDSHGLVSCFWIVH